MRGARQGIVRRRDNTTLGTRQLVYENIEQLNVYVPYLLHHLSNRLSLGVSRLLFQRFGLTVSEWRMLVVVSAAGSITAAHASQLVGIDKSLTSRLVRALEGKSLLITRKSSTDNRARLLRLTSQGERLFKEAKQVADARNYLLFSVLDDTEYTMLQSLLIRLSKQLDVVSSSEAIAFGKVASRNKIVA